jgi:hypothetical protein
VLPVTGIWMVLDNAGFDFGLAWVRIGLGLFVVAFLVGGVYLSQLGIRMPRREGPELRALVDQWMIGYGAVLIILLLAVWDMVFKPTV